MSDYNDDTDSTSSKDEKTGCGTALVLLAFSLFSIPLSVVLNGLTLAMLWRWFMEPLNLPPISAAHALGISGLVAFAVVPIDLRKIMDEHKKNMADAKNKTTRQMWGTVAESYGLLALKYVSIIGMSLIYRHYM